MPADNETQVAPRDKTEVTTASEGVYLYCVADSREATSLGIIGIDDNHVYTIPWRDICAVVHNCPPEPYHSGNQEVVNSWVMAHQSVVDTAWERWGTVLPLGFDSIIRDKDNIRASENVRKWLQTDYAHLRRKLDKVRGKAEYGVQVFWEPAVIARSLTSTSPEISQLEMEIKSRSRGVAYLYKQKLENALNRELESRADQCFRDFYRRIRRHVDNIVVDKTKRGDPGAPMIMNLSCLLPRGRTAGLGAELEKINDTDGFTVRFTGPWPPYNFVGT